MTNFPSGDVPGDHECIDCGVCRETAPANFTRNNENGNSTFLSGPNRPSRPHSAKEALMACPVKVLGDDGDEKPLPKLLGV